MKTLNNLLLDDLKANPLWTEFVRILDEQNQKDIIGPINQLLAIRDIHKVKDPEIVKNAIREQGLALTDEMMNMNLEKLHQLYHFLPLFHEDSGTPRYPKFIEFLLDRDVAVTQLWTADYQTFHESPLGPTVMEGGEWYPTNHIKVSAESRGLDQYFDLVVGSSDIKSLIAIGYTEEQALNMVGRNVNNHADGNMTQTILENRVTELFYKFAPIEEVIDQLLLSVNVGANLYFSGVVVTTGKDYVSINDNGIKKIRYPNVDRVIGGRTTLFNATIVYTDDTEASIPVLFEMRGGEEFAEKLLPSGATFIDPMEQQALPISMDVMGRKRDMTMQLVPSSDLPIPDEVKIIAQDVMYSLNHVPVALNGIFGSSENRIEDMDSVIWTTSHADTYVEANTLHLPKVVAEREIVLKAEYVDARGKSLTDSKTITLMPVESPLELEDINIIVPEVLQGQYINISAELVFNDGSTQEVVPFWEALSPSITITPDQVLHSEVVYKDFKFNLVATATSLGKTIRKEIVVDSIYPKIEIFDIDIISPDVVIGGERHQLKCLAHWAEESDIELYRLGHKTKEEILKFSSDVVAVWKNIGTVSSVTSHEVDLSQQGLLNVPEVDRNRSTHIGAMVITSAGHAIETIKTLEIKPRSRRIEYLDLIMQGSVEEDNTIKLRTIANWTDGTQSELYPDTDGYTLEYSVTIASTGNISTNTRISEDDPTILEYLGVDKGIATVLSQVIYDHILEDGSIEKQLIDQEHLLNLVPRIYLTDNMVIVAPESHMTNEGGWIISEQERMFVRATVTLEDGEKKDIIPNWNYEVLNIEDDDHPYLDIVGEEFSIEQMITILTNKSPIELYMDTTVKLSGNVDAAEIITDSDTGELLISYTNTGESGSIDIPISSVTDLNVIYNDDALFGYEEFKGLSTFKDTEEILTRTLFQTTKVTEQIELGLSASFFREEEEQTLTITDRPVVAHDIVLGYKMKGPMEFLATAPAVSYALYANYDDGGEEYGVSNDWELKVLNKREVVEALKWTDDLEGYATMSDEQLDSIYPDNSIVDIDDNGYVYPKHNVDVALRITAKYDDGRTQLSDFLDVNMLRANTELKSLRIIGPTSIEDNGEEIVVEENGQSVKPHVPYKAILERADGTLEAAELALWDMKISPKSPGQRPININIGEDSGKLYMDNQIEDQSIILTAKYEEYHEDVLEMISTQLPVEIAAAKMPVSLEVDEVTGTIKDDSKYLMTATVTFADGETESISVARWEIADSPIGVEIDNSGTLDIPQLVEDAEVTVLVYYTQGSTTLDASYTLAVTSESALQSLEIAGYSNVRDDSSIQMEAIVFRSLDVPVEYQDKPVPADLCDVQECVTDRCAWVVITEDDRASIETTTGLLHLALFLEDTDIHIQAIFQEQGQEVIADFIVHVKSSMPKFGLGPYGLSTESDIRTHLTESINNMLQGGSFTLRTNPADGLEGFAYFAHRADVGGAVLSEADGRTAHGGWGGASWSLASSNYTTEAELLNTIESEGDGAIEVEVTYDNLTETWLLYRSYKPDFELGRFAYYYRAPEPAPIPLFINLVGPDTMHEQTSEVYTLEVTYDTGLVEVVPFTTFTCDDVAITIDVELGEVTAGDILIQYEVELVATFGEGDRALTTSKTVLVTADILPESLEILGPESVDEQITTAYTYEVTMNNGDVKIITADVHTTDLGVLSNSGSFEAPTVTKQETTDFFIEYTEQGITLDASKTVTINNSNNLPISLEITGVTQVNEGGPSEQLEATVTFEDGSTLLVTNASTWSRQSGSGISNDGLGAITPDVSITNTTSATMFAEYTSLGVTVDDTHKIDVINVNKELINLTIAGANSLDEGESTSLSARAYYDDGTDEDVTAPSNWSIITGNSYIGNVDNVVTTSNNVTQDQSGTAQAEYSYGGTTLNATHIISIKNTTNRIISLEIVGATSMLENGVTAQLQAMATYEDGSSSDIATHVNGNWSIIAGSGATIDGSGEVTSEDVTQDESVTVEFTVDEGYGELSDTHDIAIIYIVPTIVSTDIAPLPNDEMVVTTTHQFLIRTHYSDGTWEDTPNFGGGLFENGVPPINSDGTFNAVQYGTGWPLGAKIELRKSNQPQKVYNFTIIPKPTTPVNADFSNLPATQVPYGSTYVADLVDVTLFDGSVVTLEDMDSIVSDSSHGRNYGIDGNGNLVANKMPSTGGSTITVQTTMTKDGVYYVGSFTFDVAFNNPQSINVIGPSQINDNTVTQYTFETVYVDGSKVPLASIDSSDSPYAPLVSMANDGNLTIGDFASTNNILVNVHATVGGYAISGQLITEVVNNS